MPKSSPPAARLTINPRRAFRPYLEREQRWACLVVHRRGGKTFGCLQDLLKRMAENSRPSPAPRYAYIAPTRDQAKDITWAYIEEFGGKIPGALLNKSDLTLTFPAGQMLRLYSGDNYERMRGLYFDGVVIDEHADIDPSAWPKVIRPCLTDYRGWATFIGTPKGKNAFYRVWKKAVESEDWFSLMLKASESGIIDDEELREIRSDPEVTDGIFSQEYECNFTVPREGTIYQRFVQEAREDGRIYDFPVDGSLPVYTVWDLGAPQNTVVWYFQLHRERIKFIDHDSGYDETTTSRVARMRAKGYNLGTHFLPHDATATQKGGWTYRQELEQAGLVNIKVVPRTHDPNVGIDRTQQMFNRFSFREPHTDDGVEALEHYHWKSNKVTGNLRNEADHDWSSHHADALRVLAEAEIAGILEGTSSVARNSRRRREPEIIADFRG